MHKITEILDQAFKERLQSQALKRFPLAYSEKEIFNAFREIAERIIAKPYQTDPDNQQALALIVKWIKGEETSKIINPLKGLVISGSTGTGKSLILDVLSFLGYMIQVQYQGKTFPLSFQVLHAQDLNQAFAKTGCLDSFVNRQVLCIQDLGSEARETLYMGNRQEVLKSVLEQRGDKRGQFTFISTNLTENQIQDYYGDRVASRLKQLCNTIYLTGKDRRK